MKKTCIILVWMLLSASLNADIIEKTYTFSTAKITSNASYQLVNLDNCLLTAPAGEPLMPYQSVALLLPPGHVATSIEILHGEKVYVSQKLSISPKQYARPVSQGSSGEFVKNEAVYTRDANYPQQMQGALTTQYLHGFAVALCSFTPAQYNPMSGAFFYYKSVTVRLNTRLDDRAEAALQNLSTSSEAKNNLASIIQNTDEIAQYPTSSRSSDSYDLLFITPSSYEASFDTLVNFYAPRGLKAKVATCEDIYATMSGSDNAEKIRNYIIQEYQEKGIQHLTLGGDVEYVPYRGFYCGVQSSSWYEDSNIPSDLYYAALDGNWNNDGDARWGEIGEDDLLPEIGVGRMCFSNQTELDAMINKTLQYQQNPVSDELNKPLLVGEYLYGDPLTYGSDYLELLIGSRNDNGYTTTGIPETQNIQKLYASETSYNKNTVMQRMNQGSSFIHHVGHANATYTMLFSMSDITNANFDALNGVDHNYAIIFSHGCICGAFDNSDCIGEKMTTIDRLAVAVYMNSRYGWFNEGQTEGPSAHLNRELVDAFYDKREAHLGMAYTLARIATAPWVTAPGQWEEGALRWNFYDCNLLGDAAISFWADEAISLTASYADTLALGTDLIEIQIAGAPNLEGLVCTVMMDTLVYGTAQTNAAGLAEIILDIPLSETGTAHICVSGYNCPLHDFALIIADNGEVHFQPVWSTPYNPMAFFVQEAMVDGANMQAGDGIGIFDIDPNTGIEICVGAGTLSEELTGGAYLEITASMDDGSDSVNATGFTPGNTILYRLWKPATGEIINVSAIYPYPGYDEVYAALGNAIVQLSGASQTNVQFLSLPPGWSGISSYLIPQDTDIETLTSGIAGELVFLGNQSEYYLPGNPASTLQNWDYHSGYFIKVNQQSTLTIEGSPAADRSISLTAGWNLISVLSPQAIAVEDLFGDDMSKVAVAKDAVGLRTHWPAQGIATLRYFYPGKAYLVKATQTFILNFPGE